MSNEVVNPFQTFRDRRGQPLAGGTLTIRKPGTSALGTAFSDSDLTIPQVVDGYQLDNFGRVQGNLRWKGLRDVESYDSNGEFNRTDSDAVTLIDASSFAINFASVAAMIADTTLVDGDVAETQSYNLDQNEGGARYIVTTSALVVDNYRVHDLAPAGLQSQLLDQERNNNFYVAGAIGDGVVDDTLAMQRVLDIAGDIECANGIFAGASLTLTASARIYGNGTLLRFAFANADMLTLSGADVFMTLDGVVMDGNLANQSAEQAIAMVRSSITASAATAISIITFNNVQFQNGSQNDVVGVGDDTGFPVLYTFSECNHIGGEEAQLDGTFQTASILMQDGASCSVEDAYFNLTTAAVVGGRSAIETGNTGAPLVNPGFLSVDASTFVLMGLSATLAADSRGAIHARDVINLHIGPNRILTPNGGGIVFGAEVDTVTIAKNMVDGLSGITRLGGIVALVTTNAAPGDNWQISGNELIAIGGVAINLDGTSAGNDATRVQVLDNLIDGPTLQAILYHNLSNVEIQDNYINMESIAGINAVEVNTDGVSGTVSIEGNEISNVDGTAIINAVASAAAIFTIDGNTLENITTGMAVDIVNALQATITNNNLFEVLVQLMQVGTLTDCVIDGNTYGGTAPATFIENAGAITNLQVGENFVQQMGTSIRNIAVTGLNQSVGPVVAHTQEFIVTGVSSIDQITDPGVDGWIVVLQSDGAAALTFNDGLSNLNLGANRTLSDNTDTLTLMWDETNSEWNQLAFSNN